MHGKKIQPTAIVWDKKGRPNEGFALRNNHGIDVPMAPATAVMAMYLIDRVKMVVHESVWALGNGHAKDAIMAAEMQPVRMSTRTSLGSALPDVKWGRLG
jgi:hypothetical protein